VTTIAPNSPGASIGERRSVRRVSVCIPTVDRIDLLREAIRDMLEILGYQVTVTRDGAEALTEYRGALRSPHPFVAAILDLTIPLGMGGGETALEIRKLHPEAISAGENEGRCCCSFRVFLLLCPSAAYGLDML